MKVAFKKAIVFANPGASNVEKMAYDSVQQLKAAGIEATLIQTKPNKIPAKLQTLDPKNNSVWTVGGDGTVNLMINCLMDPAIRKQGWHRQPYIPLPGGNANDIASMLTDGRSPEEIISQGELQNFYPLQITITNPDGTSRTRYAGGYCSFGGTAEASAQLEAVKNPDQPAMRLVAQSLREIYAGWKSVATAPSFNVEITGRRTRNATDILFANGSRIAKYGTLPIDITEKQYAMIMTGKLDWVSTLTHMIKLQQGKLNATIYDDDSPALELKITDRRNKVIRFMFDGETDTIESGSRITVSSSDDSLITYSI